MAPSGACDIENGIELSKNFFKEICQKSVIGNRFFLSFPEIMIISMLRFVLKISNSLNKIPQITQFVFRTYKDDSGKLLRIPLLIDFQIDGDYSHFFFLSTG